MERQAYIRPSSGGIWSVCNGYAALNAAIGTQYSEETDNEVREDGTACHWLAQQVWEGNRPSVGSLSPNNREITEEMYIAVDEYHALLRSWSGSASLEETIPVSQFFPGVADGTPDAWGYCTTAALLDVGDLKYGFRPVEVWQNVQLTLYAWTLVCLLTQKGHAPQTIRLTICQPRCAHRDGTTRTWTVSVQALAEFAATLAAAAQRCYAPNPPCTVNPGCGNCGAAHACRTLQAAAGAGMEVSYDATPFELNADQLGYELSKLMQAQARMEHRINGLSVQAESLLRKGQRIPAFEMGRGRTNWRWRDGADAYVKRLGELFSVEVLQPTKIKSVAQLRNTFPGFDVQAAYGEKPPGELKLRMTDPNEAIKKLTR